MPAQPTRRRLTVAYKLRIIAAADACTAPGELGLLLRREGLYSYHLSTWRRAKEEGKLSGAGVRRGPRPSPVSRLELATRKLGKPTP